MRPPRSFRHAPHALRGPTESPSEGPSGCAPMRPPRPFQHTPRTLRGLMGNSTEGPIGCAP
eukprot:429324-Pyramimonas_sp.AAC.1